MARKVGKSKAQYIEIDPNDREVLQALADLQEEMGHIDPKNAFNEQTLKKYIQQAKILLQRIESTELALETIMKSIEDFATFQYSAHKEFITYTALVKKATEFVYEFRQWVTQEEIQFVIQFENEQGEVQYAQVPIQELIPSLNVYLEKGSRVGLRKSKSRLQISGKQIQGIAKEYLLNRDSSQAIASATNIVKPVAKKQKGYGTGRIFETAMENIAEKGTKFDSSQVKLTELERTPGLRAGDLSSRLVIELIKKGILSGDPEKGFEASLKTVASIQQHTEIQNINQIKYDLFNIVAITYRGGDIQQNLIKLFKNTKKGPAKAAKEIKDNLATELGIAVNGSLSAILDDLHLKMS